MRTDNHLTLLLRIPLTHTYVDDAGMCIVGRMSDMHHRTPYCLPPTTDTRYSFTLALISSQFPVPEKDIALRDRGQQYSK